MNRSIDPLFDSRIAAWLEEDPSTAPDEALATVLAAVPSISQRHRLLVPWRSNRLTLPLRLATAAVIAVAVLGAIYLNLPGRNDVGGPSPTPRSSPTLEPTAAPTPRINGATVAIEGNALTPGVRHVLPDFEPAFTFTGSADIRFAIDSTVFAWFGTPASATASIGVVRPSAVFAEGGTAEALPEDIIAWLQARSDLIVSSATAITLGSASGTLLEGTVPSDAFENAGGAINVFCPDAIARCNFESGGSLGYAPGDHVLIVVATVNGQVVTAITAASEAVWQAMGADFDAFLRSVDFPG